MCPARSTLDTLQAPSRTLLLRQFLEGFVEPLDDFRRDVDRRSRPDYEGIGKRKKHSQLVFDRDLAGDRLDLLEEIDLQRLLQFRQLSVGVFGNPFQFDLGSLNRRSPAFFWMS